MTFAIAGSFVSRHGQSERQITFFSFRSFIPTRFAEFLYLGVAPSVVVFNSSTSKIAGKERNIRAYWIVGDSHFRFRAAQ